MKKKRQTIILLSIIVFLYACISLILNYYLIENVLKGRLYIYGSLPIHQFYPFITTSSWNDFLSTTGSLLPVSHFISNINFFEPNIAWLIHEIVVPIIGGIFMYLLLRKVVISLEIEKNTLGVIVSIVSGVLYQLALLSTYTDFWIKGFLAFIPAVPLLSLITFRSMKNKKWKKAYLFALLTTVFLSALYDWRLQISGIVLALIFSLGIASLSSISKILKERKFWIVAFISFLAWCILWLIPHFYSHYIYSLSYTRGMTLPIIVGDYSFTSVFGLYSPDKILYFLYFSIICIAFLSLLLYKKHDLSKFVLIISIVLIFITLITWEHSPLKFIHHFLVSLSLDRFDIGILFRTHKIFTSTTLPLVVVLFGLSLNGIYSRTSKKIQRVALTLLVILLVGAIIWRVAEINNKEGKVTIIPDEYFNVGNWLKENVDSYRVFWLPRTGKYRPGENTVWLQTEGWGAPETSLGVRTYHYYGKPMEYFYPFLMRLLQENKTKSAACILSHIGVKYLAIHDDYSWKQLLESIEKIKKNLDESNYFELQNSTEHIYVYKNLMTNRSIFLDTTPIIINGGLTSLSSIIEFSNISLCGYSIFFSDLLVPTDAIYSTPLFITSSLDNLKYDLLTNSLISKGKENFIIIPSRFTKGIEKGKWHPYYIDNPHHAEWEVFHAWNYPDSSFEHTFRFDWGFVGSRTPGEQLEIPININENENYTFIVRYFKNNKGGELEIKVNDNEYVLIPTRGNENNFEWFIANFKLNKGQNIVNIRNIDGINVINIIVAIPSEEFYYLSKEIDEILNGKKILLLKNLNDSIIYDLNISNADNVIIQSIEHKDAEYKLNLLTKKDNIAFGITIPELYHGGWIAIIDKNQKILGTQHFFVNNFWIKIEKAGIHQIKIEFAPQSAWKLIYMINSFTVMVILLVALFYSWKFFSFDKSKN